MDEALQPAFELRLHGNAEPAIAHSHFSILLDDAVLFGDGQQFAYFPVGVVRYPDDGRTDA